MKYQKALGDPATKSGGQAPVTKEDVLKEEFVGGLGI